MRTSRRPKCAHHLFQDHEAVGRLAAVSDDGLLGEVLGVRLEYELPDKDFQLLHVGPTIHTLKEMVSHRELAFCLTKFVQLRHFEDMKHFDILKKIPINARSVLVKVMIMYRELSTTSPQRA
jgi:hypothetical protein